MARRFRYCKIIWSGHSVTRLHGGQIIFLNPAISLADILVYAARLMTAPVLPAPADQRVNSPHCTGTLRPEVPDDRPSVAGQGTCHRARPNVQRPVKRTGLCAFCWRIAALLDLSCG